MPYSGSVVGFLEEAKDVKPAPQAKREAVQAAQSAGIIATPAVRNLAVQLKVDLTTIRGTGPDGRITVEDVQKGVGKKEETAGIKITRKYDFFGYIERVPLHGIKKTVANKMAESIFTAVQLTNMHEADVTELPALREKEK